MLQLSSTTTVDGQGAGQLDWLWHLLTLFDVVTSICVQNVEQQFVTQGDDLTNMENSKGKEIEAFEGKAVITISKAKPLYLKKTVRSAIEVKTVLGSFEIR